MSGLRRREQRAPVARIEHHVIEDVAEEMRPVEAKAAPRAIAVEKPRALSRCHQQH